MIGPGKYDGEATLVMERVKARGVIVIVIGGEKGSGMTAKADYDLQADFVTTTRLPEMLRTIADQIEADIKVANEATDERRV